MHINLKLHEIYVFMHTKHVLHHSKYFPDPINCILTQLDNCVYKPFIYSVVTLLLLFKMPCCLSQPQYLLTKKQKAAPSQWNLFNCGLISPLPVSTKLFSHPMPSLWPLHSEALYSQFNKPQYFVTKKSFLFPSISPFNDFSNQLYFLSDNKL